MCKSNVFDRTTWQRWTRSNLNGDNGTINVIGAGEEGENHCHNVSPAIWGPGQCKETFGPRFWMEASESAKNGCFEDISHKPISGSSASLWDVRWVRIIFYRLGERSLEWFTACPWSDEPVHWRNVSNSSPVNFPTYMVGKRRQIPVNCP